MHRSIVWAAALIGAAGLVGCGHSNAPEARSANVRAAPRADLRGGERHAIERTPMREPKRGAVYDTQQGFENELPPPDAVGGGPAVESDIGEPRWRGNPGAYDDRTPTARPGMPQSLPARPPSTQGQSRE
ncbi:MAG: hypothetical protein HYV09_03730 [Deltaproteobacteria bacterium]|nr:hypothetical protein [Deltaproteobacteria bacterium]